MPTEKQIEANRRNAQKSTGPKTARGKARASRNATKHGLYSAAVVINSPHYSENPKEYSRLLSSLLVELRPEGVMQTSLVHKIAYTLWRYNRFIRAETGNLRERFENLSRRDFTKMGDEPDLESEEGRRAYRDELERRRDIFINRSQIPGPPEAIHLLRYEMRLDRQLTRSYRLLIAMQKQRAADSRADLPDQHRNGTPEK